MQIAKTVLVACVLASMTMGSNRVGAQESAPQLMLDTGGHMALIKGLAFTPDGKQLVSAGDDKVIRVWDWQAGKTVRTIRGEVGRGDEGKVYAIALSPDGRWLAAGGFMAPGFGVRDNEVGDIRLYDFGTGQLVALLRGHANVVGGLSFAPDGKRLISGSADFTAIIWDVEGHQALQHLRGHNGEIYSVNFTPDGMRAVTGSYDTTLKLWSVNDGREIATLAGHKDKLERAVAVSPVHGIIASGSWDGEIRLWDGRTGQYLRTLANQGTSVGALSFSRDGTRLVSTCSGGNRPCSQEPQIVWDVRTGKRLRELRYHDNVVIASAVSPDGRLVATSGGSRQQIQIWEIQTGEAKRLLSGTGAQRWAVGVSSDGRRIAWGETSNYQAHNDRGPLEDQLRLPANAQSLGRPEKLAQAATSWVRARATHETYALAHRRGGAYGKDAILDVQKDGQTLVSIERNSSNGYDHRAYSFTPDGQTIISGGNGWLTAYDLKGQVLGNFVGHESDVWSVTPSPDARLLLSASGDQTIRLWNLKTRELIVTLFSGSNGEWVMWTPQGYYASSPDGDRIVGWQINRGSDHAAEYVNAAQLRDHFYRPDIVERGIILASATAAVAEVGRTRGGTFQLSDLTSRPPPKLSAQLAPADSETMRGRADIKLVVSETKDDPVKDFDVFVNDTKVTAAATRRGADVSFEVPLGQGNNRIRVVARSTADLLGETMLEIKQNGEGMLDRRDTLFIVAVGVDRYPQMPKTCGVQENEPCDLAFAGADAKAFAETVEKQMGAQHRLVLKRVMFNGAGDKLEPTAANILDTMDLLREAKDTDTVAVFIAGHGFNDPRSGYQFLPTNARPGDSGNWASSSVVSWPTLEASIQAAKGRRLLFVDTCHSGGAYNARLIKDASDGGVVAFSATNTQQYALELANLGHGAFTHVLMRGMNGEADTAKEKEVRVFDLGTFIEREVRKLTNGRQTPDFYKKPGAENFVMVRM